MNYSIAQKITIVRVSALLGILVLMIYAPKLWISTKNFPTVPLFESLPNLSYPLDYFFAYAFAGFITAYIFNPKRWIGITVIGLYVFLAILDQNRLQPYFYQSILTILAIVLFPKNADPKKVLYAVILVFFATYFWSGLQKLNAVFYTQWMHALGKHFSFISTELLQAFTYAVPWLEAAMGILLLFNKTRKFSVVFIVLMHSIIIFLLFYLGYGYNVVPWNVQNIVSVLVLFWVLETTAPWSFFTELFSWQKTVMIGFTILLPLSNFWGGYDHLLSYSFFTSKLNYYYVELSDELENSLPDTIHQYYRYQDGHAVLYLNEWAGEVNKVLFYPEERAKEYMDQYLRSFAKNPQEKQHTTWVVYNK